MSCIGNIWLQIFAHLGAFSRLARLAWLIPTKRNLIIKYVIFLYVWFYTYFLYICIFPTTIYIYIYIYIYTGIGSSSSNEYSGDVQADAASIHTWSNPHGLKEHYISNLDGERSNSDARQLRQAVKIISAVHLAAAEHRVRRSYRRRHRSRDELYQGITSHLPPFPPQQYNSHNKKKRDSVETRCLICHV